MEGRELLTRLTKVKAPEGFEAGVLARLPAARRERARARRAAWRYAFAGSAALVLVGVLLFNPARFDEDAVLTYAEREALSASPSFAKGAPSADDSRFLPVYERMDYADEFRSAQAHPQSIYVLEQVSETVSSEIIY